MTGSTIQNGCIMDPAQGSDMRIFVKEDRHMVKFYCQFLFLLETYPVCIPYLHSCRHLDTNNDGPRPSWETPNMIHAQ